MPDLQPYADPLALLRAAALRDPDAPALVSWDATLRYGELVEQVARIASYVRARTPDGVAIATLMPRTPAGLAGVLGCLVSGRICLVLNPADPIERLAAILADARPFAMLAEEGFPDQAGMPRLSLEAAMADANGDNAAAALPPVQPDAPAGVFYTSGSTGRPKGIVLSMRAMMFRVAGAAEGLALGPSDSMLATSPVSTSGAICTMLAVLHAGAKMLPADMASHGATALFRLAARERATFLSIPVPVLRALMRLPAARESFASARLVVAAAASLPEADVAAWRPILPAGCAIRHNYASTEAGYVAHWELPPGQLRTEALSPAGYPRPGYTIVVNDEAGREVARGEAGEVVITSRYLALGEWSDGALVRGHFAPGPDAGACVFRTGDIMRHGADGLLRFVSRGDRQIKVNGIRVEPGEIEAIIRRDDGIVDVIVMPRGDPANASLHAFVAAPGLPEDAVRARLRTRLEAALPHGMRPARITILDALPMMGGGKVDGAALRALADAGELPAMRPDADPLSLLRAAALRDPNAPALVSWTETLSYGELAKRVARIAWHIRSRTPEGAAVATLMPRTPAGLAGVLGCLFSGRTCLVLNPADPTERLAAILADARPFAMLADDGFHDHQPGVHRFALDAAMADASGEDTAGSLPPAPPDGPTAVFYTSGSTGRPKGIVLSMRAIMFRATGVAESVKPARTDVVLVTSLVSTSGALCTLLAVLAAGARLLVVDMASDGATALFRLAARERANVLSGPVPVLRTLLRLPASKDALAGLRKIVSGAAPMPQADVAAWRLVLPSGCAIQHNYASTEAGFIAYSDMPIDGTGDALAPAGHPRSGYRIVVTDEAGHEVARGEAGEVVITSLYLALGEWSEGALVRGHFAPGPEAGARVFRTGDIMRHGADGLLRFVSRGDRQIKVNGIRVEPGEIEAIIRRETGVMDVIVMPRGDLANATLHAFVAAPGLSTDPLRATLRTSLTAALPHGMRPARITILDALPMMRGGKVDGTALRALAELDDVS